MKNVKFTRHDQEIIQSYKVMIQGLADYLGNSFELILHSLEDLEHSAVCVINGFHTGREEGAPITDLALRTLAKIEEEGSNKYSSYFTHDKNGQPMKSTTIAIYGSNEKIIALLCVNFHLNTPFSEFVRHFIPVEKEEQTFENEFFASDVTDLFSKHVQEARQKVMQDSTVLPSLQNKAIIGYLYRKDIFRMKNSVVEVAKLLDISVNTVYLHLRTIKEKNARQ